MGTTVLVIAVMLALAFIFPMGAAYYAFKKGRQGWAIATIVSIFVGMGWLVGVIALMVPAKPREGELKVPCPKCAGTEGFTKTTTVDRETGKPVQGMSLFWGFASLAIGGVLVWLGLSLWANPIRVPAGTSMNISSPLYYLGFGVLFLSGGIPTIINFLRADKVKLFTYKCGACGHQWERREDEGEGEGSAAAISTSTDGE